MEPITSYHYNGEADLPELISFLHDLPEDSYHLVDLPYRFSSPQMQGGRSARVWRLEDGRVVGLAAWQQYWAMLDYFVRPGPWRVEVERAMLSWALEYFWELDRERRVPLPYWVEYREDDEERRAMLAEQGFELDEDYCHIRLRHELAQSLPEPNLPAGFHIRSLAGEGEVNAYVALHRAAFESESMTREWRARTLRTPQYQSALDLVVVAEDGELAGFCVGWFDQAHRVGQVEPLGVHPRYHRRGLGRALLLELLRRFKAHGARYAIVEPISSDPPAVRTYEAVGFGQHMKILLKGKWMKPRLDQK